MLSLRILLIALLFQMVSGSLNAGDTPHEDPLSDRIFAQRKKAINLATEAMSLAAKSNRSAKTKADKLDAKISEEVGWNLKDASNLILGIADLQKLIEDSRCSADQSALIELRTKRSNQALAQLDSSIEALLEFFAKAKSSEIRHEVIGAIVLLKEASSLLRKEILAANSSTISQR